VIHSLDPALGSFAALAISGYRRFISPYKGYACAHRVKYGGDSCSEFARKVFAGAGWRAGLEALVGRFRACHAARQTLQLERREEGVGDVSLSVAAGAQPSSPPSKRPTGPADFGIPDAIVEGCCWGCGDCCLSGVLEVC
jgi:putative component of membrane protein insertase Oxa1/YidC/SpoIIIJ protein YidD